MEFLQNNIAAVSLIALVIAIVITIWRDTNLGTMALALSFIIGVLITGGKVKDIVSGYPTSLLLMLVGVTYFFGIAQTNGTLDKITKYAVKSVKGNIAMLPVVLFFVAFIVSSVGPGQISTSALFAAPVMALAVEVGIPPLLMALVVGNGAQAGAMSPLAPNGVVGNGVLAEMGVTGWDISIWLNMLTTHIFVAIIAYFICGGMKLIRKQKAGGAEFEAMKNVQVEPFTGKQKITLVAIAILILLVIFLKLDLGFTSFILGTILILAQVGDEKATFKAMPWSAIVMVTGVSVLVNLMSDIGGMELFADIMAKTSTPKTVTLVVGFFSAIISAYASTSGVIMPAFLPMAPMLLEKIGASPDDLKALVSAIVVAGHVTDMSPLSTTGAVFISAAPGNVDRKPLYKGMIYWGFSMSVVGAILVWLMFGVLNLSF